MEGSIHVPTITRAPDSLADLADLLSRTPGFDAVCDALDAGNSATIDGAWASSSALAVSAVARRAEAPVLVVIAHPGDLDAWAGDLFSFSQIRPSILPAWDNVPSGSAADEIAGQRLRLLKQLTSNDPPRIVLATFQALVQPVPDRAQLSSSQRTLRVGESI